MMLRWNLNPPDKQACRALRGGQSKHETSPFALELYPQSTTCSCCATQLLGAPTLLEDSQRYIPPSVLETLFNFCST